MNYLPLLILLLPAAGAVLLAGRGWRWPRTLTVLVGPGVVWLSFIAVLYGYWTNVNVDQAYWTWINQQLRFYPTPDANYTVRIDYVMQPPDLAVGADVPVVPLVYHDVLVWSAIEAGGYRERDWLGRQFAETKKEAQLKRMEDEYLIRQRQSSSHVKQSGYWNSKRYPFAHSGW